MHLLVCRIWRHTCLVLYKQVRRKELKRLPGCDSDFGVCIQSLNRIEKNAAMSSSWVYQSEQREFPSTSLRHKMSFYSQGLEWCLYQVNNKARTYWTFRTTCEVLCSAVHGSANMPKCTRFQKRRGKSDVSDRCIHFRTFFFFFQHALKNWQKYKITFFNLKPYICIHMYLTCNSNSV